MISLKVSADLIKDIISADNIVEDLRHSLKGEELRDVVDENGAIVGRRWEPIEGRRLMSDRGVEQLCAFLNLRLGKIQTLTNLTDWEISVQMQSFSPDLSEWFF